MGYDGLSDTGKAVAEAIECHVYANYLQTMTNKIPGYEVPASATEHAENRLAALPEAERKAVECFLAPPIAHSMGYPIYKQLPWKMWLMEHLKRYPSDMTVLHQVEQRFTNPDLSGAYIEFEMVEHKPKCTA